MSKTNALRTVLGIAIAGFLFSGYLTVRELGHQVAQCSPIDVPGTKLGAPPCVYGLAMYAAILFVAVLGLVHHHGISIKTARPT